MSLGQVIPTASPHVTTYRVCSKCFVIERGLSQRLPSIIVKYRSYVTIAVGASTSVCRPLTATIFDKLWYQCCAFLCEQFWHYGAQSAQRLLRRCCSGGCRQWSLRFSWGLQFFKLQQHYSDVEVAQAAMQRRMKSSFRIYMLTILNQIRQSTEAYQLSVESNCCHWGRRWHQAFGVCAHITERLDIVRWYVSDSGEACPPKKQLVAISDWLD